MTPNLEPLPRHHCLTLVSRPIIKPAENESRSTRCQRRNSYSTSNLIPMRQPVSTVGNSWSCFPPSQGSFVLHRHVRNAGWYYTPEWTALLNEKSGPEGRVLQMLNQDVPHQVKFRVEDCCPSEDSHYCEEAKAAIEKLVTDELMRLVWETLVDISRTSYHHAQTGINHLFIRRLNWWSWAWYLKTLLARHWTHTLRAIWIQKPPPLDFQRNYWPQVSMVPIAPFVRCKTDSNIADNEPLPSKSSKMSWATLLRRTGTLSTLQWVVWNWITKVCSKLGWPNKNLKLHHVKSDDKDLCSHLHSYKLRKKNYDPIQNLIPTKKIDLRKGSTTCTVEHEILGRTVIGLLIVKEELGATQGTLALEPTR